MIVDDLIGARPVPPEDGLRLLPDPLDLRDVAVEDRGVSRVEGDPPLEVTVRVAMNVAAVDDQVMGNQIERVLALIAFAEGNQVVDEGGGRLLGEFDEEEAIMVSAR